MQKSSTYGVSINRDVVEQIVKLATLEVEGVSGMTAGTPIDIKRFMKKGTPKSCVDVAIDNGAIIVDTYIDIKEDAKPKAVAEAVQENVKDKVQSMTSNAVASVNVHICGVEFSE